jgi:replicative DNA helicase
MDTAAIARFIYEDKDKQANFEILKSAEVFLYGEFKKLADFYVRSYEQFKMYPEFDDTEAEMKWESGRILSFNIPAGFKDNFIQTLNVLEMKYLEEQLQSETNIEKKRKIMNELSAKFRVTKRSFDVLASGDLDLEKATCNNDESGLIFNIKMLQESVGRLVRGASMVVVGVPGGGKTTQALNMVYLNSIMGDKKCLYLYGENVRESYIYNLFSRWSYDTSHKVSARTLKQGLVDKDDIAEFKKLFKEYKKAKKGEVYFVPFSQLSNEPFDLAGDIAHLIKEYDIDYFVVDHVQKFAVHKPTKYGLIEYMNRIVGVFTSVGLGDFGTDPTSVILLSQLNREGEKKAKSSRGSISIHHASGVSALEQDAFVFLHVYVDDALKDAGEFYWQLLKSRDGKTFEDVQGSYANFEHYFMGDVQAFDDVYNVDALAGLANDVGGAWGDSDLD